MATEILMPKLGLTMKEGTVVSWLKQEGESVAEKESLLDIETEKLSYSVEAPASGVILKRLADEGEKYPVSAVLGYIGKPGENAPETPASAIAKESPASDETRAETSAFSASASSAAIVLPGNAENGARIFISPVAKKMAIEQRIDIRLIKGTGPNGRIVKADVESYIQSNQSANSPGAGQVAFNQERLAVSTTGSAVRGQLIPYTGLRRAVGETMKRAWETIPMVTHQVSADAGAMQDFRRMLNAGVEDSAARVTIGELMLRLTAAALAAMPVMNSSLTEEGIIYHQHVNIGMATALDEGLIVPVIQDADKKGLLTVSREAKDLSARARAGALTPDDVHGATFTVSNLGGYGSVDFFTPIINPPQAAILGIGRITDTAAPMDGEIIIRRMMGLSLTYDHRIIDGATAAEFFKLLLTLLENPARAVLN